MVGRKVIIFIALGVLFGRVVSAQESVSPDWIRPDHASADAVWGIKNGIVFSLWPYGLENKEHRYGGGP